MTKRGKHTHMEHSGPSISIVMPSFNQASFLGDAIESVLDQNYPKCELIVIDGGSADNSVDIIRKHEDRISFWVSEKDTGQSHALNKGFREVSGDIVGWLNSDDTYQPDAFAEVARVFADPDVAVAMCREFALMDSEGTVFETKINTFEDYKTLVRYWKTNGMTINQPSVFIRKSVLDGMDPVLDETLHYAMDYDLWLRIAQHNTITVVDGHWANYRFHDTSKSGLSFDDFYPEWKKVSRRHWGNKWSRAWLGHALSYFWHRLILRYVSALGSRSRRVFGNG